jgi:hypothetical protein
MTQDEIIKMAKQAGARRSSNSDEYGVMKITYCELEAFAKMVAEKEREECAKIADEWSVSYPHPSKTIAELIRARGQE